MFVLFCLFIGNTLTPLTALTPVSDVGKTMLQPSSLSVLGDHQQFQAGLFVFICFCLFVYLFLFVCLFMAMWHAFAELYIGTSGPTHHTRSTTERNEQVVFCD